jgi:hypothetical protein
MRRPVRVGSVGVVAATWALFFPPSHPRKVTELQGDTPRPPPEGAGPLWTSPGLREAILLMTTNPQLLDLGQGAADFSPQGCEGHPPGINHSPSSDSLADRFPVGVE